MPSLWSGYDEPRREQLSPSGPHTVFDADIVVLRHLDGPSLGLETTLQLTEALRGAAEQIPLTTLKEKESGSFCTFCPGVAELQTGSPFKMYQQAEVVAEARMTAYNVKQGDSKLPAGAGTSSQG